MIEFWQIMLVSPGIMFLYWLYDLMEEHLRKMRLENDKKEQELNEKK